MIIFIYGTTAEAIKVAPVARRLDERGIPYEQWLTMQHTRALLSILPELGLRQPDRLIANGNAGKPLKGYKDVVMWVLQICSWLIRNGRSLRKSLPSNTVIVVHGDTMTSVVGAFIAKRLKVQSAHIEAGLRSGNWRHPFPEELDRRIVGKFANIHYAPSEEAAANLAGKQNVVYTHGNTVIDAVLDQGEDASSDGDKFGVVLLHRFEFISNQQLVEETISILSKDSPYPLKLLVDAYSEHAVQEAVDRHGRGKLVAQPKLRHQNFIGLLRSAQFIVTDSGGIQAESALLGVPTLVHRKTTEQQEGIGSNIVLSEWDPEVLSSFLNDFENYRRPARVPEKSPSDIVVDDLVSRGFARP